MSVIERGLYSLAKYNAAVSAREREREREDDDDDGDDDDDDDDSVFENGINFGSCSHFSNLPLREREREREREGRGRVAA